MELTEVEELRKSIAILISTSNKSNMELEKIRKMIESMNDCINILTESFVMINQHSLLDIKEMTKDEINSMGIPEFADKFDLYPKAYSALMRGGVKTVGELCQLGKRFHRIKTLGPVCRKKIIEKLDELEIDHNLKS